MTLPEKIGQMVHDSAQLQEVGYYVAAAREVILHRRITATVTRLAVAPAALARAKNVIG